MGLSAHTLLILFLISLWALPTYSQTLKDIAEYNGVSRFPETAEDLSITALETAPAINVLLPRDEYLDEFWDQLGEFYRDIINYHIFDDWPSYSNVTVPSSNYRINITVKALDNKNNLRFGIKAFTNGWMGLGFVDPASTEGIYMLGSDVVLGYYDSEYEYFPVSDYYIGNTRAFSCPDGVCSDSENFCSEDALDAIMEQNGTQRIMSFTRLRETGDVCDQVIAEPGSSQRFITALNTVNDLTIGHVFRYSGLITIPQPPSFTTDRLKNDLIIYPRLRGSWVRVNIYNEQVTFNGVPSYTTDQVAHNGIAHILDGYLLPNDLAGNNFTIAQRLQFAGLNKFLAELRKYSEFNFIDNATLAAENAYTVFAPSEDAFNSYEGQITPSLLRNHFVKSTYFSAYLSQVGSITTLQGQQIEVYDNGFGQIIITFGVESEGSSYVQIPDYHARNGIVHIVTDFIVPPNRNIGETLGTSLINFDTSLIRQAFEDLGRFDLLTNPDDNITFLAPFNDALYDLEELQQQVNFPFILESLIIEGSHPVGSLENDVVLESRNEFTWYRFNFYPNGVFLNGKAEIIEQDIPASNGLIHVTNNILNLTSNTRENYTISQFLNSDPQFSFIYEALNAANLLSTLNNPALNKNNSFTLFAPTNDAFNNLNFDPQRLLKEENLPALRNLLRYHLVNSTYYLVGLQRDFYLNTSLSGTQVHIVPIITAKRQVYGGLVNDAIIDGEQNLRNGVTLFIDAVLIPPGFTLFDEAPSPQQSPQPQPVTAPQPSGNVTQPQPATVPQPSGNVTQPQPATAPQPSGNVTQPQPATEPQPSGNVTQPQPATVPQPSGNVTQPQPATAPQPSGNVTQPEPEPEPETAPQPSPEPEFNCYAINSCVGCMNYSQFCSYCSIPPTPQFNFYRGRCLPIPVSSTNTQTCFAYNGSFVNSTEQCPRRSSPQPAPQNQTQPEPESVPAPQNQTQPEPVSVPAPQNQTQPEPESSVPAPQNQTAPQPQSNTLPNNTACYNITACTECTRYTNCAYCSIPPTGSSITGFKGRCVPSPVSTGNTNACSALGGSYVNATQCPKRNSVDCQSRTNCSSCLESPNCFYCATSVNVGNCLSKTYSFDQYCRLNGVPFVESCTLNRK